MHLTLKTKLKQSIKLLHRFSEGLITKAGIESDLKDLEVLKEAAADFGASFGEEFAGKLPEINKELTQTQELLGNAFGVITNGIQSGIQGLIDGSKEFKDLVEGLF